MKQDIKEIERRSIPARHPVKPELVELWSVEEVAERLHVSRAIVYKMIHEGQLEAIRIGRLFRITPEGYRRMLEHQSSMADQS